MRRRLLGIAGLALVAALAALLWSRRAPPPGSAAPPVADAPVAETPPPPPVRDDGPELLESPGDEPTPWANVDLEAVREALPDNLYWELAAPTTDPRLLSERERQKRYWDEVRGRMASGDASDEEIRAYFEQRQHRSSDYVRFIDYLLDHHGQELPDRDLELLNVARRLQMARLGEIPKRMQEAFDRRREQDAAREAWLADETAFESDDAPDVEAPPAFEPDFDDR